MYERFQKFRSKIDEFVDDIEELLTELVEQLAEDIPPLGFLILFINMVVAIVEAIRSFLYIFQFVEDAFERGVSAFNATSVFIDRVGWSGGGGYKERRVFWTD